MRNADYAAEIILDLVLTIALAVVCFLLPKYAWAAALALGLALTGIHFVFLRRRYRAIARLSEQIDNVLHGQQTAFIPESREGELAIAEDEIRKMTVRLSEQTETLLSDKRFLADALADISHQMRTPLTAVNLAAARLGQDGVSEEERRRLLREMKQQLGHISWLVESLLHMSKIDAGTAGIERRPLQVSPLLDRVLEEFRIPCELRGIMIERTGVEGELVGDAAWLAEALSNLIKNCLEHLPRGGTLRIVSDENKLFTEVLIEDDGDGFAPEDMPYLFDRFYRGKNASSGSVGIGLALARSIVNEMGGVLTAENREEGGARFRMRFYRGTV